MTDKLLVLCVGSNPRMERVLEAALEGVPYERRSAAQGQLPRMKNRRVLFAVSVGQTGTDCAFGSLLSALRADEHAMENACAAMLVDGSGELYTKQAARMLMLAANMAGAWMMGKPLLEATGSLNNLAVRAKRLGVGKDEAYGILARELVHRLQTFLPMSMPRKKLLMLHASNQRTSNTLALGNAVCGQLQDRLSVQTLSVRNGTLHDCKGCSYKVCAHFAEQGTCFYGGAMVESVYPAILASDILLILCPNYNDAIGANMMALINRLTSLTVNNLLEGKLIYGIVVSGYSGGDLVAEQLLGALCLNKAFTLPPRCCMLETANDPGEVMALPGIGDRITAFANRILAAAGS